MHLTRRTDNTPHRRDVDDGAVMPSYHVRQNRFTATVRPVDVHCLHLPPFFFGDVCEQSPCGDARIVDERIHMPELQTDVRIGFFYLRRIGHIGADRQRLGACPPQLFGKRQSGSLRTVIVQNDGIAVPCQLLGDRTADALCGARDPNHFPHLTALPRTVFRTGYTAHTRCRPCPSCALTHACCRCPHICPTGK